MPFGFSIVFYLVKAAEVESTRVGVFTLPSSSSLLLLSLDEPSFDEPDELNGRLFSNVRPVLLSSD